LCANAQATARPRASEQDIDFILSTISDFLDVRVSRSDVLSSWSGIRPLPAPKKNTTTENVVRDHGACVCVCAVLCVVAL